MGNEKINCLNQKIKGDPYSYKNYKKRAYCYLIKNDIKSALFDFIKARRLNKNDRQVIYGAVYCYFKCGFYEKAVQEINKLKLSKQPDYISFNGGRVKFRLGLKGIKSSCLNKMHKNTDIIKRKLRGVKQYIELKKYKKAEDELNFILNIEPKNFGAVMNLAYVYRNMGKESLAVKFYKKAKKINPGNKQIIKQLALTHVQAGNLKRALSELVNYKKKKELGSDFDKMISYLTRG